MDVTSLPKDLAKLLRSLEDTTLSLVEDSSFYWSPKDSTVHYDPTKLHSPKGVWSLLHECGHARLGHSAYGTDFELVKLEALAWEEAKQLGKKLQIDIAEEHVQDCLDTYRDWLHQRSTCPTCGTIGLQADRYNYSCHNCNGQWSVTASRFCRTYRRKARSAHQPKEEKDSSTFL